jgi:hypothetical protein
MFFFPLTQFNNNSIRFPGAFQRQKPSCLRKNEKSVLPARQALLATDCAKMDMERAAPA